MADGEDFLYRPCRAGMCTLRDLKENKLDLMDIILANEALDVEAENQYRITEYHRNHGQH